MFRPDFDKGRPTGSHYTMHTLPTGATPVPKGENGQRKIRGWDFYYGGLENENTKYNVRSGSRPENLFPKDRMGSLDGELLSKMGLTTERMVLGDALSFYQLLLPICNPTRSGIPGDARKPFFSKVEEFTNSYAYSIRFGGSLGTSSSRLNFMSWLILTELL